MAKILIISNDGEATFYEDFALPADLYDESFLYGLEVAVVEALEHEDAQAEEAKADTWVFEEDVTEED